jgi:Tol biopolymer transport system component
MYVSFKNKDDSWTEPYDLGDILKMDANQPSISPDGKYIFFISNGQTFWVDTKIIEELKPKNIPYEK